MKRPLTLINVPSNLGLRPLHPGHEPGTWRAPQALAEAGLVDALTPADVINLPRPVYDFDSQLGTKLRNGHGIRAFNLRLADTVAAAIGAGKFPVVIGGDCSVLLGSLAGARRFGALSLVHVDGHSLVHVDGHSDFRHPGNCDADNVPRAVAGMDLALATGRGETLLTQWPEIPAPLIPDAQVVQIGERENRNPDFPWPDINDTAITRIDIFTAQQIGASGVLKRTRSTLNQTDWPFWLHFDVDVLDQSVMPAVDSPGSPGMDPADLAFILRTLLGDPRCAGLTVTIFDPDLDPDGTYARVIVSLLHDVLILTASDRRD